MATRATLLARRRGGVLINASTGLNRIMSNTQTALGALRPSVLSTNALTSGETSVSIAFLALFGRSPDNDGLAYWSGVVGSSASITTATNTILNAVSGSMVLDSDNATRIALIYHHLLGKTTEEDPAGQAYWTNALVSGTSLGTVVETIITLVSTATGFSPNTMKNRLLALESICRVQKSQSYSLSVADSRAAVLRVTGDVTTYNEAMVDMERLLISRTASTPLSWGKAWTTSAIASSARAYENTSILQCRNIVWYNRSGNMMLATLFLPSNFSIYSQHGCVMALHGGGWRQGYPEKIYNYCTAFAAGTSPSYVVAAPTYRLSAYGFSAPAAENDVADFYSLLTSASFLNKRASLPSLFGESSGGHLACLLGAKQNTGRVLALYPPINLTGDPAISSGLDAYVDYYAPTDALKVSSSANLAWSSGRTTQFQLWHGNGDWFVPPAQSGMLDAVAGSNCSVIYKDGEGHGFTVTARNEVIASARSFFNV